MRPCGTQNRRSLYREEVTPMKKLHASGEDYLEAVLVLQKGKRHGKVRGCGPAHRSLQAQCMPCSDNTEGQRFSNYGQGLFPAPDRRRARGGGTNLRTTKPTLTFLGMELHLRKQTVKWGPCISRIWSSLHWLTWPSTLAGSSRRNRSTRLYGTSFRRAAART